MSMFSGLEAQSEIDGLLDALFGNLGEASQGVAERLKRYASQRGAVHPRSAQGQAEGEEPLSLGARVETVPGKGPRKLAIVS